MYIFTAVEQYLDKTSNDTSRVCVFFSANGIHDYNQDIQYIYMYFTIKYSSCKGLVECSLSWYNIF